MDKWHVIEWVAAGLTVFLVVDKTYFVTRAKPIFFLMSLVAWPLIGILALIQGDDKLNL